MVSPTADSGPLADWVTDIGARHVPMALTRRPGLGDIRHLIDLRRLMRRSEVVHLHSSKAGALGRLACLTLRKRNRPVLVFTPHAWSWLVGGSLSIAYRWLERRLQTVADRIIAVSEGEAAEGRTVLGAQAPIDVISNGVDLERFSPTSNPAERSRDPLVVCVGRFARQKGQDVAIEALAMLSSTNTRLRLVGDGEMEAELRRQADDVGVADRIEWADATPDPGPHMRAADVMVIPSRWDGLSLVLLEGMASGAAIVATRVGGAEVADGVCTIVEPEDPVSLSRAIDELLADPERRQKLGQAARKRAEQFGLDRTLELTGELWGGLLEAQAGSRR